MASMAFFGFLTTQKPAYEDRVAYDGELPQLRNLWTSMEEKCFDRYIEEVNDDHKGMHVYQVLKHEMTQCKMQMQSDNRRDVLQECHSKIVALSKKCTAGKVKPTMTASTMGTAE
eukprot:TRINITY_DN100867_c0_g1_i1.p3 TRINITY_DN100867_c0_g1~~TRINITY_DN100867_c0_g1_i1.p3  ORF type:complete len:115 (-),score=38.87 TRINITY_DN100867_c0_g1_i1:83-427(-)